MRRRLRRVEEHLLGCGACTASAQQLADLAQGIRSLVGHGAVRAVVAGAFIERAAALGLRVRAYTVPRGGSVNCTIAPEDDLLVARLEAPLADVQQLDLLMLDIHGHGVERARDIPFDPAAREVVMTSPTTQVRALAAQSASMQLIAVDRDGERLIGEYTFHHTPWAAG